MSNPNSNLINILCWNIRSISTKLHDKILRDYLTKFSIIGFVETMKDKHFALNINGFVYYNFPRKHRHTKAKRASRGIGILIANWLNKSVQIKEVNDCLVWITIKYTGLTNLKKAIMIGIVYIPPRESCHTVDTLESEFAKYFTSCHVMYCGDFNSRTGSKDDFIENPNCSNHPNLTIKSRINRDEVSNTHGESMLDLSKTQDGEYVMVG